jgi:hypothetical protein
MNAEDLPARAEPNHDPTLVEGFKKLLQTRLGTLATTIFDARLQGWQMKNLIGLPELHHPSRHVVKWTVQQIKKLAREFAEGLGDPDFLWQVERLMDAEAETIARRTATTRQRHAQAGNS